MLKKQWEEPVANVIQNEVQLEIGGVDLDRGSHDDLEAGPQTGNGNESVQNRQHSTVSTPKKIRPRRMHSTTSWGPWPCLSMIIYVISSKKQRMNLTWDSKLDKFLKDLQRYLDPKLPVH